MVINVAGEPFEMENFKDFYTLIFCVQLDPNRMSILLIDCRVHVPFPLLFLHMYVNSYKWVVMLYRCVAGLWNLNKNTLHHVSL